MQYSYKLVVISGTLILAVAMGIGRFAFTPIFPIMQEDLYFTAALAGYLASANYLGYLIGALLAGIISWGERKAYFLKLNLVFGILSTFGMGLTESYWLWSFLRLVSGVTSGFIFVLASSIVLDLLADKKAQLWFGIFYSGVGLGIFFTGSLTPFFSSFAGWEGSWIGMGILSILLIIMPFIVFSHRIEVSNRKENPKQDMTPTLKEPFKKDFSFLSLLIAYGCQGLGYIISGTFLVAIINESIIASTSISSLIWAFVGIAAVPSSIFWALLGNKWGKYFSLKIAYLVQIIGVIFPIIYPTSTGALIGGFLFGATFMGIVTLAISAARDLFPIQSNKVIGKLTLFYATGQILGPVIAGNLINKTGNYNSSLIFAASILFLGFLFLILGKTSHTKEVNVNNSIRI